MLAELQPRMSSMSLGGPSPPEGGSPTRGNTRASARIARSHRAGGAYNPSDFEFKITPSADDGNTEAAAADVKTTVMIRNIPNKYTQEIMLSLLEEAGLNGSFDFFYLPIDFRNRCGLGYSFLNFLTHADAEKAYQYFHKRRWDEFNSKKVCEVTYARVQGRDNLVQHFKNAKFPSTDTEYCPLVYRHTENEEVRAHMPLPIHNYLESLEEEAQVEVNTNGINQETQEEEVVKDAEE
jgi:RNA recognition motif-containing protein